MRKFKLFLVTLLVAMTAITLSSCHGVKVGADEEAVLVMHLVLWSGRCAS